MIQSLPDGWVTRFSISISLHCLFYPFHVSVSSHFLHFSLVFHFRFDGFFRKNNFALILFSSFHGFVIFD